MENNPPSVLPSLANAAYFIATSLLTFAGAVVGFLFRRRLQSAEIHKTSAEAVKTEAETRQIDSQVLFNAYDRLDRFEDAINTLNQEQRQDKSKIASLEWELGTRDAKIRLQEAEIRQANAELKMYREKPFSGTA